MIDIDKKIDELVNNHSKLDLAQMVVERDSSIETLNELIEKTKCCENCKFIGEDCYSRKNCKLDDGKSQWVTTCHNFDHWQLK